VEYFEQTQKWIFMVKEDILTAEEVAKYLRIHPYTIKRLAREGKFPGFKVGGQWRFRKDALDKWSKKSERA